MLHRERLRLEAAIRTRTLSEQAPPGHVGGRAAAFDAGARLAGARLAGTLLARLGPARLLELVVVDGDLHVLVCGDGRIRHAVAGAAADAGREVDFARFGLWPRSTTAPPRR